MNSGIVSGLVPAAVSRQYFRSHRFSRDHEIPGLAEVAAHCGLAKTRATPQLGPLSTKSISSRPRTDPCRFSAGAEKGSPAEAGLEVGGPELAYRSTALSVPSPDRGTNIMFCADTRLRRCVLIRQHCQHRLVALLRSVDAPGNRHHTRSVRFSECAS